MCRNCWVCISPPPSLPSLPPMLIFPCEDQAQGQRAQEVGDGGGAGPRLPLACCQNFF